MSGQLDELKASHQERPTFFFYFYREICLCICICLRIRECALNHRGRVLVHTLRPRWEKREQRATGKRNCVLRGLVRCRTWSEMAKEKGSTRVCRVAKMNYRRNAGAAAGGYNERNRVEGRYVGRMSDSLADKFLWADLAEDSRKCDVKSTAWSFG